MTIPLHHGPKYATCSTTLCPCSATHITVAILAQGTHWAVASLQAFFVLLLVCCACRLVCFASARDRARLPLLRPHRRALLLQLADARACYDASARLPHRCRIAPAPEAHTRTRPQAVEQATRHCIRGWPQALLAENAAPQCRSQTLPCTAGAVAPPFPTGQRALASSPPPEACTPLGIYLRTVWPSGLRRWLQAPVRKGVGSNPTAVTL